LLLGPWISDNASAYSQLPQAKRLQFIDDIIDSLMTWRGAERLQMPKGGDAAQSGSGSLMSVLLDQVEECKRNAEPQERKHISQFVAALQFRFLTR
jgi:hypothetical protein